jgi:hypothetical protein
MGGKASSFTIVVIPLPSKPNITCHFWNNDYLKIQKRKGRAEARLTRSRGLAGRLTFVLSTPSRNELNSAGPDWICLRMNFSREGSNYAQGRLL